MTRDILAVLVLGLVIRVAWFLTHPISALDALYPDDTYIVLVLAREMAATGAPTFEGVLNNGFQPLFTFWLAFVARITGLYQATSVAALDGFTYVALATSAAFHLAGVPFAMSTLRQVSGRAAALAFGLFWVAHPYFFLQGVNGLETSLAGSMLMVVWWWTRRAPFAHMSGRQGAALGVLLGVAILARVDMVLMGLFFAVVSLKMLRETELTPWLKHNARVLGPMLATLAPWWLYSYVHTGHVIQQSGPAVRYIATVHNGLTLYDGVGGSILTVLLSAPCAMLALALLCYWGVRQAREALGEVLGALALPLTYAFVAWWFYALYVPATFFFERYLCSSVLVFSMLAFALLGRALMEVERARWVWCGLGALVAVRALGVSPAGLESVTWAQLATEHGPEQVYGYRNAGLWARENLPKGARVGANQSGALAYWAPDVHVLNLDGVVSRPALDAQREGAMGAYLEAHRIDRLLVWEKGWRALEESSRGRMSDAWRCREIKAWSWGNRWRACERLR